MHQHNITQALAEARVADLQGAATHRTATVPPRRHRRGLALLGLAATAALAPTIAIAERSQPAASRYFDIEANKAAGMRALGLATMERRFTSPYRDLQANKASSLRQAR